MIPRDLNLYDNFNNEEYDNDDSNGYLYEPDMGKVIGEHSGALLYRWTEKRIVNRWYERSFICSCYEPTKI